jgi:hypothetical protein
MEAAVRRNTGFSDELLPIAQDKNSRKDAKPQRDTDYGERDRDQ